MVDNIAKYARVEQKKSVPAAQSVAKPAIAAGVSTGAAVAAAPDDARVPGNNLGQLVAKPNTATKALPDIRNDDATQETFYQNSIAPYSTFKNGLLAGSTANIATRCYLNDKYESKFHCIINTAAGNMGTTLFLEGLNLKSMVGAGLPYSIAAKVAIDLATGKDILNVQYGMEIVKHSGVLFSSFAIPATLLSFGVVTSPFDVGFMITALPAFIEPAVEAGYSLAEEGICSLTGFCSNNAIDAEL